MPDKIIMLILEAALWGVAVWHIANYDGDGQDDDRDGDGKGDRKE